MYEFGINNQTFKCMDSFQSVTDYKSNQVNDKSFNTGSKPGLLFQGELFQNNDILKDIKSFFIDYFNGQPMTKFNLMTFDHVIVFTVIEYGDDDNYMILFRHYKIEYQSSQNKKLPYVHLKEIGPSMDLILRRFEKGNDEIMKQAYDSVYKAKALLDNRPKQKNILTTI